MIFSRSVTPRELINMRLQRSLSFKCKNAWFNFFQIKNLLDRFFSNKVFYFSTKSLSYKLNFNIIIQVEFFSWDTYYQGLCNTVHTVIP